ncbi:MAG: hypothetical protein WAM85_06650 [Terracidiphilus sp.]
MRLSQQSRPRVSLFTLCGLALGIAVAMWGASYKMEQYPLHGHAFRVMAPAKLLTEKERPRHVGGLQIVPTRPGAQRPPLRHLPASFACVYRSVLQACPPGALVPPARRKRVLPEFIFFSFRPPPPRFTS